MKKHIINKIELVPLIVFICSCATFSHNNGHRGYRGVDIIKIGDTVSNLSGDSIQLQAIQLNESGDLCLDILFSLSQYKMVFANCSIFYHSVCEFEYDSSEYSELVDDKTYWECTSFLDQELFKELNIGRDSWEKQAWQGMFCLPFAPDQEHSFDCSDDICIHWQVPFTIKNDSDEEFLHDAAYIIRPSDFI